MRYFHRSSLDIDSVLAEADTYFGARLSAGDSGDRTRSFSGTLGELTLNVRAEGGHYTNIDISTDQAGESELDKLAKRFMGTIHTKTDSSHVLRGAY
jgi:hypothetical protein